MELHADDAGESRRSRRQRLRRRRDPLGVFLGFIGELMITAGLFLGLFVVWQIWWTDIEARQVTNEALADFDANMTPIDPTDYIEDDEKRFDDAPLIEAQTGETFATYRVPRWGEDYRIPIKEGTDLHSVLHQGFIGHYETTQMPGQIGNFAIAAHRQSHGAAFYHVDKLEPGDALIVEGEEAWFVYTVESSHIVLPSQAEVIAPVPGDWDAEPTERYITMTTCHPLFSMRERFIVHGTFEYWAPRDAGIPKELDI